MNLKFSPFVKTELCEIMGRNKSDKGSDNILDSWHNYTTVYYSLFKDICKKELRVFELGLGTNNPNVPSNMGINGRPGASLYGWNNFFPNSNIFGADIDKEILFNTDKIKTFYCDQTNPEIIQDMWNNDLLKEDFDIIIEDGLHKFEANVCFFENSIHKIKSGGYYIIEDISNNEICLFENKMIEWRDKYKECTFLLLKVPSKVNFSDNNLLIIYKS